MIIQFALIGMGLLFLIGFTHALFAVRDHRPAVIINKDGIWVKYFGLTPWNNIAKIDLYTIYQTPMQYVGIQVNNVTLLAQQASFFGRCALFWSKMFNNPPITLINTIIENYEIVRFAQQFMRSCNSEKNNASHAQVQ